MGVGAFDLLDDYRQAAALFGERLSLVGDDDWANSTPCDDWDVRSLVAHLIVGEFLVAALFRGEGGEPIAEDGTSVLGPSPMATWRDLARACGTDSELPEGRAVRCLDFWLPLAELLTGAAARGRSFAEPVLPPDDSPAGVRLLALLGRGA